MPDIRAGTGKLIAMSSTDLEQYRSELTAYCYRMLGSGSEAEDAVQESLLRAWRTYDEKRSSPRTWLYRIATTVCLDMLRGAQRRALAMDLGPASEAGGPPGVLLPAERWIQPILLPEDQAVQRETIRLAFVAALQHLPPKQRAVLILRDVLSWSAREVAGLLDTSVASVTSALQRARAALPATTPPDPPSAGQRELLERYVAAFESHDVATLVSLLREDATMSMPPVLWWLSGREQIRLAMSAPEASCEGARLIPVEANGSPAFWQTRPGPDGTHRRFALVILTVSGGLISDVVTYLAGLTKLDPTG
jgi:RNA polymerase sigma-70 factor (ECF subfamily)